MTKEYKYKVIFSKAPDMQLALDNMEKGYRLAKAVATRNMQSEECLALFFEKEGK